MNNYFTKISKFLLYLVPFTLVIVYAGTLFPFIVGKYTYFRTIILLALVFFVWGWARGELERGVLGSLNKNIKPHEQLGKKRIAREVWKPLLNPLAWAIGIFALIFLLAGFLGYNPSASFWSNFERGEGSLQLLCLFVFFGLLAMLFRDRKSWNRLFMISLGAGLLVFLYGLAADALIPGFIGASQADFMANICQRFGGSLGNAAYVGTFMLFALFYSAYLFIENSAKKTKWVWASAMVLFFIVLLLSQTRGALLGLGAAILGGLIYLFFSAPKQQSKKIIAGIFIFLLAGGLLAVYYRNKIDIMPFCGSQSGGNRIIDISTNAETYQTRLVLWEIAIKSFKDRPILGWGPENFAPAFEAHYNPSQPAWFDRAHDIFFDYLVITGALGLLSFLSIFVIYYWIFMKNAKNLFEGYGEKESIFWKFERSVWLKALIFALPIAYLVQGAVLFDVLPTYINLFLFLAFVNFILGQKAADSRPSVNNN
ncbi:MAG: O-antigen ligase family protein [Candidatus Wolfebacteria bacterium]|nr:O-antigen ligase family protein [Candidatus Wolfebacteria bacterium]